MKQLFLISIGWALVGLACCNTIAAQEPTQKPTPMTAADCMAYAVSHNRDVRKAALTLDSYQANRLGAIGDFLPAVSASGSAQYNFGRGIDPETNTYTNVTTFSNGFGISASLPVFDGLARLHALRMARADVLMGKSALQRQQADVALQTLQAFIDAQYYQGTVAMAEEKEAESLLLLRQARLLEEVGRKSPADVAQMEAQQAEASVEVIRQRNLLQQAMLNLKHIMNWQEDPSQDPSRPPREGEEKPLTSEEKPLMLVPITEEKPLLLAPITEESPLPSREGWGGSLGGSLRTSSERQAFYNMESAHHALRRAKASLWPSISLSGGWSTSYYKTLDAPGTLSWGEQMRQHRGEWVAANVSFPLFGRLGTMTSIRRARNNYRFAQEDYQQKLEELNRLHREAILDAEAYRREAEGMLRKVEADSLAYTLTRHQWDEGLSTAIDVKNTSATLLNSRARLLQARLMAVLKRYLADRLSPSSALRGMEAEGGRDYETEMKINNLRINN